MLIPSGYVAIVPSAVESVNVSLKFINALGFSTVLASLGGFSDSS